MPLHTNAFNLSLSFPKTDKGKSSIAKDDPPYQIKTVVIDAGHGGRDPGCSGSHSREKHIALAIALQLAQNMRLQYPELKVILTRDSDVFIPLHERAAIANRNKADLFISIHCNYMPGSSATKGTETYVMGLHTAAHNLTVAKRENAAILLEQDYELNYDYDPNSPEGHILLSMFQNAYLEQSIRFAQMVEDRLHVQADRKSRGVKQAGFVVLKETAMPSVLIETGFLSSRTEESWLNSPDGQQQAAGAILQAFDDYKYEIETGKVATPAIAAAKASDANGLDAIPEQKVVNKSTNDIAFQQDELANVSTTTNKEVPNRQSVNYQQPVYSAPKGETSKIGGSPYPLRNQASSTQSEPSYSERSPNNNSNKSYTSQATSTASNQVYPEPRLIQTKPVYQTSKPSPARQGRPRPPIATADTPVGMAPTPEKLQTSNRTIHSAEKSIFFYVQLAASARPLDTRNGKWQYVDYQIEVVKEGSMYKYQARNFPNYQSAEAARISLQRVGFSDAWIVAYRDGERIPTQDALEELNIN